MEKFRQLPVQAVFLGHFLPRKNEPVLANHRFSSGQTVRKIRPAGFPLLSVLVLQHQPMKLRNLPQLLRIRHRRAGWVHSDRQGGLGDLLRSRNAGLQAQNIPVHCQQRAAGQRQAQPIADQPPGLKYPDRPGQQHFRRQPRYQDARQKEHHRSAQLPLPFPA